MKDRVHPSKREAGQSGVGGRTRLRDEHQRRLCIGLGNQQSVDASVINA
jgi:hypothetical protein